MPEIREEYVKDFRRVIEADGEGEPRAAFVCEEEFVLYGGRRNEVQEVVADDEEDRDAFEEEGVVLGEGEGEGWIAIGRF